MLDTEFLTLMEITLGPLGARAEEGEEYRGPPLEVLGYFVRRVSLSRIPLVGRALSVVAVVRQPIDLGRANDDLRELIRRVEMVVSGRFPPVRGLVIGLTIVVRTPDPIQPDDDERLSRALQTPPPRSRCAPLGLFRLNLGQEALALAIAKGPDQLFPEPEALADAFTARFQRYLPGISDFS